MDDKRLAEMERFKGHMESAQILVRLYGRWKGSTHGNESRNPITEIPIGGTFASEEFYETNLPVSDIIDNTILTANPQIVFYDQSYSTFSDQTHLIEHPTDRKAHPKDGGPNTNTNSFVITSITHDAKKGSGGNYLSNELPYRIARLRTNINSSVKAGHFHLGNFGINPSSSILSDTRDIVSDAIKRALNGL